MDVSTVSPSTSSATRDTATLRASAAQSGAASGAQTAQSSSHDVNAPVGGPPYTSPVVEFASGTGTAILQFRDQTSGQLQFQVPSRTALQYAEAAATSPTSKPVSDAEKSGGDVLA